VITSRERRARAVQYAEIREELERQGFVLTDEEYEDQLAYARRKASVAGKDESYIPLLLPDVIRQHFFGMAINAVTFARMAGVDISI
jgi:hypothetical protein